MTGDLRRASAGTPTGRASRYGFDFMTKWTQFTQRALTDDSLQRERRGFRRWLLAPHIAFVIPIDEEAVRAQLIDWQRGFLDVLPYQPEPVERLHVTLHYVGLLRTSPWMLLPNTWQRASLDAMAARIGRALTQCEPFTILIGPLNAFPNVLIAEVHDTEEECLRAMRLRVRRALPLRARPATQWNYLPHITLGYWGQQLVAPLIERLRPFRDVEPVPLRVSRLRFTIYWRSPLPATPDVLVRAREELIAEYPLTPRE